MKRLAGRPKGSTNRFKKNYKENVTNAKYKIASRFEYETKECRRNGLSKKAIYKNILQQEISNFKLKHDFKFPYHTVISRLRRTSLNADGGSCPLIFIEDKIIKIILCMSKIKRSLTAFQALKLVNELIDKTLIQEKLIQWKKSHKIYSKNKDDMGKVGLAWWNNFLRRNHHLLRTKSGKKYAVDRSNFSTYLNFLDMYQHIEDILVYDSKVASKFDKPKWMNGIGEEVFCENDSVVCKVSIDIKRPDMCIVMDEVECNLSQENDHSKGGQKFVCEVNEQPYQSVATKSNHFTCLGPTLLNGQALMCVVISVGKKKDLMTKVGIDWNKLKTMD